MNPQQVFSWELGAAVCSWYFSTLVTVVVSGLWWVWNVFSFAFLPKVELGEQEDPFLILGDTDDPVPQRTSMLPLFTRWKCSCGACRGSWILPRSVGWIKEESIWDAFPTAFLLRPKQRSELQIIFPFSKTLELPICFPRALRSH